MGGIKKKCGFELPLMLRVKDFSVACNLVLRCGIVWFQRRLPGPLFPPRLIGHICVILFLQWPPFSLLGFKPKADSFACFSTFLCLMVGGRVVNRRHFFFRLNHFGHRFRCNLAGFDRCERVELKVRREVVVGGGEDGCVLELFLSVVLGGRQQWQQP